MEEDSSAWFRYIYIIIYIFFYCMDSHCMRPHRFLWDFTVFFFHGLGELGTVHIWFWQLESAIICNYSEVASAKRKANFYEYGWESQLGSEQKINLEFNNFQRRLYKATIPSYHSSFKSVSSLVGKPHIQNCTTYYSQYHWFLPRKVRM